MVNVPVSGDIVSRENGNLDQQGLAPCLRFPCRSRFYTMLLSDETARIFCSEFYHALIGCSHTVKKAFELAVGAVNKEKPNAGEKFLLLPESEFGNINRLWLHITYAS